MERFKQGNELSNSSLQSDWGDSGCCVQNGLAMEEQREAETPVKKQLQLPERLGTKKYNDNWAEWDKAESYF